MHHALKARNSNVSVSFDVMVFVCPKGENMNKKRTNKLYNFLVNTYGLSKELVMTEFDKRIDDLITKHLASKIDSNYIQNLILDRITKIITEGVSSGCYNRSSFEDYVKKCVKEAVTNHMKENYNVEMKMVSKDASVVHKVF